MASWPLGLGLPGLSHARLHFRTRDAVTIAPVVIDGNEGRNFTERALQMLARDTAHD